MNDLSRLQPELFPNGIKGRTIFPRHLNDSVDFLLVEFVLGHVALRCQVAVTPEKLKRINGFWNVACGGTAVSIVERDLYELMNR